MRCPYSAGVRSGGSRPSDKGGVGVCNNEVSVVADPDLQIRGGGWGSVIMRCPYSAGVRSGGSRPSDKGGGGGL